MKKSILFLLLCFVSIASFGAVKVGDQFTYKGNTYQFTKVDITKDGSDNEVNIVKWTGTGDITFLDPDNEYGSNGEYVHGAEDYKCHVVGINSNALTSSSQVTSISIPSWIKTVKYNAFAGAPVTTLNIPSTVTVFEYQPSMNNLVAYNVDSANPNYSSEDGVLFNKDKTTMIHYPADKPGTDYTVLSSVTKIDELAFYRDKYLVNIYLPSSLTSWTIRNETRLATLQNIFVDPNNPVFGDVDGVLYKKSDNSMITYPRGRTATSYTVPSPIQKLNENAFCEETDLISIVLGETVEILDKSCFNNLSKLSTLTISKGVNDITSGNPITRCPLLARINVDSQNEKYSSNDGVLFDKSGETLITYPVNHGTEYIVPDGTKYIDKAAFQSTKIEKVTFPSSLLEIKESAFKGANLSSVQFDGTPQLTTIGGEAFQSTKLETFECPSSLKYITGSNTFNISSLKSISLNEGLESLGNFTFSGTGIKEVNIPKTVKSVGTGVFQNIKSLETAKFEGENTQLNNIVQIFYDCDKLKTVDMSGLTALTSISNGAFANCSSLSEIQIPNTVTRLGDQAFRDCTSLTEIQIPGAVTTLSPKAFNGCTSLAHVYFGDETHPSQLKTIGDNAFQDSGLEEITIPDGVTNLGDLAFYQCKELETVNIPAGVTSIKYNTFQFCDKLTEFNVAKDNATYSSADGYLLSKDKKKLMIFPTGKANNEFVLLPPSITTIGMYSFYNCPNLTHVTIPKKVTEFESRAFYFCDNLTNIIFFGEPATTIGEDAFPTGIHTNATIWVRKKDFAAYRDNALQFWKDFDYENKVKTSFYSGEEEYMPMDATVANMINSTTTVNSLVLPATVTDEASHKTYNVQFIGDYAFEENNGGKLKEVITFDNVKYIGAAAFKQTSNPSIENIIFVQKEPQAQLLSTYRFELLPGDLPSNYTEAEGKQYMEIKEGQHIYVRKSDNTKCQSQWAQLASQIDYKIPDAQIGKKYGTFAREFDVDFADCADNDGDQVIAFTAALTSIVSGGGDYGEAEYHVRMESINVGQDGDGTYVPKNTGVLLKCMNANATSNAYYCIGERASNDSYSDGSGYSGDNVMKGTTVDAQSVISNGSMYVMSGGLFHKVNNGVNVTMPVHKAYLTLPVANMKVVFFMDDDSATFIDGVVEKINADEAIYNLSGMRVKTPTHGIYVKGGKKIIVK